ncbi:MAG TPA: adenosine deaminase, partial [Candidatus Bathyarchaeia archaeon]|nr:adenosine deaminase [Candidatus Bathyarchaeia archaeon]
NGINKALVDGKKNLDISSRLIMCFLRHLSEDDAIRTLDEALKFKDVIYAVGLDSTEVGNPISKFEKVFDKAVSEGFLPVAHAGEEGPPEYIWDAINKLHVKRIDHGVRCLEDEKLVAYLVENQIPLTVCPLSNVKLCVCKNMKEHPIKKMLDKGLLVTVNSDDPAYFGGYIAENFKAIYDAFNLTKNDIYTFCKNSFKASFLEQNDRKEYISKLDRFMTEN